MFSHTSGLVADALSHAETKRLGRRILDQCEAEVAAGFGAGSLAGGAGGEANRTVRGLQNKGPEFIALLEHDAVNSILAHVLGDHYQLSSMSCELHQPGGTAKDLHTDQWWFPQPQRSTAPPRIRTGAVTRRGLVRGEQLPDWQSPSDEFIAPCVRATAIWCASDICDANGSTMVMPASHLTGRHPTPDEAADSGRHLGAVALTAPAGSLCVYDARLWHQINRNPGTHVDSNTGLPTRLAVFAHMCAPFCRQRETLTVCTLSSVVASASPALRERLGHSAWQGFGRVGYNFDLGYNFDGSLSGLPRLSAAHGAESVSLSAVDRLAAGVHDRQRQGVAPRATISGGGGGGGAAAAVGGTQNPATVAAAPEPPSSGPFLDDYSSLPAPTTDPERWRSDLDTFGYCMIEDALTHGDAKRLALRVLDQAAAEAHEGVACYQHGDRQQQRLWSLLNKGDEFVGLLSHDDANGTIRHILGTEFQVSSMTGSVAQPGAQAMSLRTEQWWMPPPMRRSDRVPRLRPGSVTRKLARAGASDSPSDQFISPCVAMSCTWVLSNAAAEAHGGTHVVPRSHLSGRHPATKDAAAVDGEQACAGAVPLRAKAGTCIVCDGRLWHGSGANSSSTARLTLSYTYCGPQFRMSENNVLATRPEVLAEMPDDIVSLLGFKAWNAYGMWGQGAVGHGLLRADGADWQDPSASGGPSWRSSARL